MVVVAAGPSFHQSRGCRNFNR